MSEDPGLLPTVEKPKVFRNIIQLGQLLPLIPALGMIGLLIRLTWTAGATYEEMHGALIQEQARAANAEAALKQEMSSQATMLAQKIDATTAMEDQKLNNLSDKISGLGDKLVDLKAQVGDIVKASTPTTQRR